MLKKKKKKNKERKQKQSRKNYKENIGTKLITNTKKHKLKIQSRVGISDIQCYIKEEKETEKKKKKKSHRNYIKKNYRYKIDNIYQKAKIKNLEFGISKIQC